MTNERSQDVCLIAIVASVAIHVALMFWARPQVMTSVAPPDRRSKRGPVVVREVPRLALPKGLESFPDEVARREAPTAGGDAAAPLANDVRPLPVSETPLAVPSAPVPEAELEVTDVSSEVKPAPLPVIGDSVRVSEADAKPAFMSHAGSDIILSVPPPSASVQPVGLGSVEPVRASLPPLRPASDPEHVVPKEVMEIVDERFVEREKEAVRRLIDVDNALDIAKAVSVRLEKSAGGGWTYFRVTLTPKISLPSVPKDVVILLDASGSIGADRLESCRKAAKRILRTCANTGDRFNLVAFRDRFSYAFRSWRECDAESFAAGDRWLDNLASHGRTDVFATIRSVLTLPRDPKRPLIALVVTDGDANEGVKETKEILAKFTALNDGLVSVYMYGVRRSSNRELIDVLTHGNRGESSVYDSRRKRSAGDGIDGFSERFRDPLVTDLRMLFASPLRAVAYPTALKNLYRGNSVTVTGRVPGNPASLDFVLKGLAGDHAYDGFFRLPLAGAAEDPGLAEAFAAEAALALQVR